MKVLLVAQNINEQTNQELATPFGLLYLAAYANKYLGGDIQFTLIDGSAPIPDDDFDIVGISAMSLYYPRAVETARTIKKKREIPIIIGGPHITALPLTIESCFDIAVRGEGEETFLELLKIYGKDRGFKEDALDQVKGIAYWKDGEVVVNPLRPLIDDLDSLPFPAREMWNLDMRIKWTCSSRGCPYGCPFCCIARTRYRQHSVPYFIREVMEIKEKYGSEIIAVQDDLFCVSKTRLQDIISELEKERLKGSVGFAVSLRADQIDEELVRLLKEMNVMKVFVGAESGSEPILKYYKEGKISVVQMQKALDLCFDNGIRVEGSFIIGAPYETVEDLLATYNFVFNNYKAAKFSFVAINYLTPYPGTQVWEYAKRRKLVSDNMDWTRLDLNLRNFDPYRCVYLNEHIPLSEFVNYVEIFEELNAITTGTTLSHTQKKPWVTRLDKDRIRRFKGEMS